MSIDVERTANFDLTDTVEELVACSSTGAPVMSWIQVARVGKYRGHSVGPFEFTAKVFERIIENFRRTTNRSVPVDFEHATEMAASDGDIATHGAPATGWIVELANRGAEGLWGLVEWLEPGLSYVRAKRYRFFSPAIVFNKKDEVTGENIGPVLVSGGLTNRPFLDGMAPLMARAGSPREETTKMKIEELTKALALALGETSLTPEECIDRVTTMKAAHDEAAQAAATMKAEQEKRDKEEAEKDVDGLIAGGHIANTPEARTHALDVRMKTPKAFASIFANKKAATKAKDAAVKLSAEDEKALTTSAAPTGGTPPPPKAESAVTMRWNDRVHAMAVDMSKKDPEKYLSKKGVPNALAYQNANAQLVNESRQNPRA